MENVTSVLGDVTVSETVREQLVTSRLTEFYRAYAPSKLWLVSHAYKNYKDKLPELFDELLKRYPKAPRDFFAAISKSVVCATHRGVNDPSNAAPSAKLKRSDLQPTQPSAAETLRSINDLLAHGAQLLAEDMPVPFSSQQHDFDGANVSDTGSLYRADGASSSKRRHRDSTAMSPAGFPVESDVRSGSRYNERSSDALLAAMSLDADELEDTYAADEADFIDETTVMHGSPEHQRELNELQALIAENAELARQVALAEQQVLQKRFEILFRRLVLLNASPQHHSSNVTALDTTDSTPSLSANVRGPTTSAAPTAAAATSNNNFFTIADSSRRRLFRVSCSTAQWQYMLEAPLSTPLSSHDDAAAGDDNGGNNNNTTCVVQHAPSNFSAKASSNVVAMAMRVWSRMMPHTIAELVHGEWYFHRSNTLWWQWPTACEAVKGVAPESMLTTSGAARPLLPLLDQVALIEGSNRRVGAIAVHSDVAALLTDAPVPKQAQRASLLPSNKTGAQRSDEENDGKKYWTQFLAHWDSLSHRLQYNSS